jgi:hypothetical protein
MQAKVHPHMHLALDAKGPKLSCSIHQTQNLIQKNWRILGKGVTEARF